MAINIRDLRYHDILSAAHVAVTDALDAGTSVPLDSVIAKPFHLSVTMLESTTTKERLDWQPTIDALVDRIRSLQRPAFFILPLWPKGVEWTERRGVLRMTVMYVMPTVDEGGTFVPGYMAARFDVAGVEIGS
jgi:hypothetical protein